MASELRYRCILTGCIHLTSRLLKVGFFYLYLFLQNALIVGMNLIFLDTETTGNDTAKDRLCQVCYKTSAGVRAEYFKPPVPISTKAMSITHITNKKVADMPAFIGSEMKKELEGLLTNGVLVAHNAEFDVAILENEGVKVPRKICTLRLARHLDENGEIPEYNMQFLRYYFDLDVEGEAHSAEGDVNVLYALFQKLLARVKEKFPNEDEAIAETIRISSAPMLFKKINFGKHKDKTIEEVLRTDRGYLEWLLKEKLKTGEKDPDWIYTLQEALK